jgi:hypothetical protein
MPETVTLMFTGRGTKPDTMSRQMRSKQIYSITAKRAPVESPKDFRMKTPTRRVETVRPSDNLIKNIRGRDAKKTYGTVSGRVRRTEGIGKQPTQGIRKKVKDTRAMNYIKIIFQQHVQPTIQHR